MKSFIVIVSLLFTTSAFANLGLSDKVCRSANFDYLDCHFANLCEKKNAINHRRKNENFNKICAGLYTETGIEDPMDALEQETL